MEEAEDEDEEFDFGKAKMDYFNKRAREILTDNQEFEYEGTPMPLGGAYKSLKHSIKNQSTVASSENKPHYMKMTFSMGRAAPYGGKLMDFSKTGLASKSMKSVAESNLNPLLMSIKDKS